MKKLVPNKKVAEQDTEKKVVNNTQAGAGNLLFQVGVKDPETDSVYLDYDIRGLTGADEEDLRVDARKNKGRFINALLSRCITHIGPLDKKTLGLKKWTDIVMSLVIADQDLALMEIRKQIEGNELTVESVCPECGSKLKTAIGIDEFPIKPFLGELTWEGDLNDGVEVNGTVHTHYSMRLPDGLDRELYMPIAEKNEAKGLTLLLTRLVKFEGIAVTAETFRNMTMKDRRLLETDLSEHNFGYDLTTEVDCPSCGETYKVSVGNVNFT